MQIEAAAPPELEDARAAAAGPNCGGSAAACWWGEGARRVRCATARASARMGDGPMAEASRQQNRRRYVRTRRPTVRLQIRLSRFIAKSWKRRSSKEQEALEREMLQTLTLYLGRDLNEEV